MLTTFSIVMLLLGDRLQNVSYILFTPLQLIKFLWTDREVRAVATAVLITMPEEAFCCLGNH